MLRNLGLTQCYKIINTLRSRFSGHLYKVELTQRSSISLILVLNLLIAGLSDRQRQQLEEVEKLFQTHDQVLSLDAISLESNQLIVVQSWYESSTLDQGVQLSIAEGRQLLLQSLEFVLVALGRDINLSGLQPDSLSWDSKRLTILPLGAIAAQIQSPTVIWHSLLVVLSGQ
ncbi:hypothetical protein [Synechococcus elongatus]|uniref:Uncharacterized protein n=1 Tax=Synechococcus elongatus PCC 11802 TaxID=2283154 RepID=A0AAT9JYB8_SYNEL|nr:hypothetical protein EKO22_04840 [Synechococcus elongatus PCC 11802]